MIRKGQAHNIGGRDMFVVTEKTSQVQTPHARASASQASRSAKGADGRVGCPTPHPRTRAVDRRARR